MPLRDEIECCYNEQSRRHLGDDQGPWLPPKILYETHRNKSALGESVEQADLPRINKSALRSVSIARVFIAEVPKNGVKALLKMFNNSNLCPSDSVTWPSTAGLF